ncbi:MAG: helix-turn-helix transcriptional regulator [Oscillospiraceae bacterium]|nr:helix-turn-helix transcriptional regulator [Oscillospiraceae bacterium]
MELGEKLRTARMEIGLTQKQVSQGIVTRNMLSQIENGSARPSMKTLEQLAKRLGKNISFFLEDTAVLSGNCHLMEQVRDLFDEGKYDAALLALEAYRPRDAVFDRERSVVENLCLLALAEKALEEGKKVYAKDLLGKMTNPVYCGVFFSRSRLLLEGRLGFSEVSEKLPQLDPELMLRAKEAAQKKNYRRAAALLDACENQHSPDWLLLRGKIRFAEGEFEKAKSCLMAAEGTYPAQTAPMLEVCCRELGDYKGAYEYACKQKRDP